MKRWDFAQMLTAGRALFESIHKKKRFANPNHDAHLMAREMSSWLNHGILAMINGTYTPRCLHRYYFKDETVDQLHLSDRIFQNILLKQLKPTFPYVMNPNCYHLQGPGGVKAATKKFVKLSKKSNQNMSYARISSLFTNRFLTVN